MSEPVDVSRVRSCLADQPTRDKLGPFACRLYEGYIQRFEKTGKWPTVSEWRDDIKGNKQ